MIYGIGVDIEEISRFTDDLKEKILSSKELEIYNTKGIKKQEYLAGRFSAKEALTKAYKKKFNFTTVSVLNKETGEPYIEWDEYRYKTNISISHTNALVISYVLLEIDRI